MYKFYSMTSQSSDRMGYEVQIVDVGFADSSHCISTHLETGSLFSWWQFVADPNDRELMILQRVHVRQQADEVTNVTKVKRAEANEVAQVLAIVSSRTIGSKLGMLEYVQALKETGKNL